MHKAPNVLPALFGIDLCGKNVNQPRVALKLATAMGVVRSPPASSFVCLKTKDKRLDVLMQYVRKHVICIATNAPLHK